MTSKGPGRVELELLAATGVTRETDEKDQVFLARVARAAAKLPEDAWDAFSDKAQGWVEGTVKALNSAKKSGKDASIDAFPADDAGATEADTPTPEENTTVATTETKKKGKKGSKAPKPAKAPKGKKAAEPKPAKAPKAAKVPKPPKEKRTTYSEIVRKICIENPDLTDVQIAELAKKAGHEINMPTLRGVFQGVRGTFKALTAMGFVIRKK